MQPRWEWIGYVIAGLAILTQYLDLATVVVLTIYGAEVPAL